MGAGEEEGEEETVLGEYSLLGRGRQRGKLSEVHGYSNSFLCNLDLFCNIMPHCCALSSYPGL